jgi:hypothetical protein
MANFVQIMSAGLNALTEASQDGTMLSCRYFVPVYDYRIDESIDPVNVAYSNIDVTTVVNETDLIPTGEIIWNANATPYSLSTEALYLISAGSMSLVSAVNPSTYINAEQRILQKINLSAGLPLSPHINGTLFVPPNTSASSWTVYNATSAYPNTGINDKTMTKAKLFNSVVYASIGDTLINKAVFQCKVAKNVGTFKFNKIGLYAVKLDAGFVETGDPFLFAQCIIPYTQIKSTNTIGGAEEVLVDFQIELNSTSANFSNLLYGTSGDYWQKRSEDGGMLTHDNVYIVNSTTTDDVGLAKIFVSTQNITTGPVPAAEDNIEQIILQKFRNGTDSAKQRAGFKVNDNGSLTISLSGDTSTINLDVLNLQSTVNGVGNIGTVSKGFGNVNTNTMTVSADINLTNDIIFKTNNNSNIGSVSKGASNIFVENMTISAGLVMGEHNTVEIGSAAKTVKNIFATDVTIVNDVELTANNQSNIGAVDKGLSNIYAENMTISAGLVMGNDNTVEIGSAAKKVKNIFATDVTITNDIDFVVNKQSNIGAVNVGALRVYTEEVVTSAGIYEYGRSYKQGDWVDITSLCTMGGIDITGGELNSVLFAAVGDIGYLQFSATPTVQAAGAETFNINIPAAYACKAPFTNAFANDMLSLSEPSPYLSNLLICYFVEPFGQTIRFRRFYNNQFINATKFDSGSHKISGNITYRFAT